GPLVRSRAFVFFFSSRRRHTRSKRDWSSDVCSSDLGGSQNGQDRILRAADGDFPRKGLPSVHNQSVHSLSSAFLPSYATKRRREIGRASCREREKDLVGSNTSKNNKKRR